MMFSLLKHAYDIYCEIMNDISEEEKDMHPYMLMLKLAGPAHEFLEKDSLLPCRL